MKKILYILLTFLATVSASAADNSAQTLDGVAEKLRKSPSIAASYTLSIPGQSATSGSLTLAGDKFAMRSPQLSIWYDGTTQWSYVASDNEVTVDTPTAHELQQVNPLIILNNFRQNFTSKTVSSSASTTTIQLTAKNAKADIRVATVTINSKTRLPQEIKLSLASGKTASIRISSITVGKALPVSTFRFQKSAFPKAYINDLR